MNIIEKRLHDLGAILPIPSVPSANYVSFVRTGNLVFVSGQTSVGADGVMVTGRLNDGLDLDTAKAAARLCGLRLIAQMKVACDGDLTRVVRIVKLGGFVSSLPQSSDADIPKIINGCSDLMVEVFSDLGKHARFAVGSPSLPRDAAVEIDAVFEIKD